MNNGQTYEFAVYSCNSNYNTNAGTAPITNTLTLATPNQGGGETGGCQPPIPTGQDCILIGLPPSQNASVDGPASGTLYDNSPYTVQVAANNAAGLTPNPTNTTVAPCGTPYAPIIGTAAGSVALTV